MDDLKLPRVVLRADQVETLRASVASARLEPEKVRVQIVVGEPDPKRQRFAGFRVGEDEHVLGTYRTHYDGLAGRQAIHIGFIFPRSVFPTLRLEGERRERVIEAIADLLIADLERTGDLSPDVAHGMKSSRRTPVGRSR